jgi:cellulose synthase (UDP-forming)
VVADVGALSASSESTSGRHRRPAAPEYLACPPDDSELIRYLRGGQGRWLFWLMAAAFGGVAVSSVGFALRSAWTMVLLVPLGLYLLETLLSLRTSTYRRMIDLDSHTRRVAARTLRSHDSVDVFLPCAGESLEMLANTYRHVANLRWNGPLTVYVLDDSGRSEVDELARSYGFRYLARPTHELKKAGNLRYAFERSSGDHIFLLDADFVPRPDALHHLVPYLDDPSVGIVQSPQFFDTHRSLGWLERGAGATQELFYRWIQPSRSRVGAAICVGSSAVYRRAALTAIGGFPQVGHSEDVYTGLAMSDAGFRLEYVPAIVTKGVCPDRIDRFVSQQYRWCEGSMTIVADHGFHENPSVTPAQRMCFWSGFLYYVTTALNVLLAPVAVCVMIWAYPDQVGPAQMLPLVGSFLLWLVVLPLVMRGRWRMDVLRVQVIYGFAHALSILHVVRGATLEWIPSRSSGRRSTRTAGQLVSSLMFWHIAVSQAVLWVGIGVQFAAGRGAGFWALVAVSALMAFVYVPVAAVALGTRQLSS